MHSTKSTRCDRQLGETLPLESLNALSPEIMEKQATINLGTLGHVSHGKSTIVSALSGVKTNKHSLELKRNITIKLGYANFKIYRCGDCPKPKCYQSFPSSQTEKALCCHCLSPMELIRHYSMVDCPGHEYLMATMLNGAAVMNAALLLVSANQAVPQPQTMEHLAAAEMMNLQNMCVLQSKIDLVPIDVVTENYRDIKEFVKGSIAEKNPIIPLACKGDSYFNVDILLQYLAEKIPVPKLNLEAPPIMHVVRSFDINKPGISINHLKGGIAGGTLVQGVLRVGEVIEIRPGLLRKNSQNEVQFIPLLTKVVELRAEENPLEFAVPGGLIAIRTTLDPTLTKSDRLQGQVIGKPGQLPDVYQDITIRYRLMKRMVKEMGKIQKVDPIKEGEILTLNIGCDSLQGRVQKVHPRQKEIQILLVRPSCIQGTQQISISRKYANVNRLIGSGTFQHGIPLELLTN